MKTIQYFSMIGLILTAACGSQDFYIEPSLEGYVIEFFDQCENHGVYTCKERYDKLINVIEIKDITDIKAFGVCHTPFNGRRNIEIDKFSCSHYPETCKVVVWHELGHCLYGLEHTQEGVMRSYAYRSYPQEMIDNFFNSLQDIK